MANKKSEQSAKATAAIEQSQSFVTKNKKTIFTVLGAVVALILGIFIYKSYISDPYENKTSTMLATGQQYFDQEAFDIALNGDKAGYIGFKNIADEYGSAKAGNLAYLYAGLCYANLDKWKEAEQYLSKYSSGSDAMISPAAQGALGDVYAHLKKNGRAIECFKKAAKMADSKARDGVNISLSPIYLLKAGKILESEGKFADALKIYQDIKKNYVNSNIVISSEIDKYIERASLE